MKTRFSVLFIRITQSRRGNWTRSIFRCFPRIVLWSSFVFEFLFYKSPNFYDFSIHVCLCYFMVHRMGEIRVLFDRIIRYYFKCISGDEHCVSLMPDCEQRARAACKNASDTLEFVECEPD